MNAQTTVNEPFVLRKFSSDELKNALRTMCLIRSFEEGAENCYMRGLIHGTMHLSIGRKPARWRAACSWQKMTRLRPHIAGHGHCIAKGAEVTRMFAEFFGKENGYCKGRGGSMHIGRCQERQPRREWNCGRRNSDCGWRRPDSQTPENREGRSLFFGDGANNEGAFHESLNMASVWQLPVIFVCENNQYGMSTPFKRSTAAGSVSIRAAGYSMPVSQWTAMISMPWRRRSMQPS